MPGHAVESLLTDIAVGGAAVGAGEPAVAAFQVLDDVESRLREGGREGGEERGRMEGREGGREGGRKRGREGGRGGRREIKEGGKEGEEGNN